MNVCKVVRRRIVLEVLVQLGAFVYDGAARRARAPAAARGRGGARRPEEKPHHLAVESSVPAVQLGGLRETPWEVQRDTRNVRNGDWWERNPQKIARGKKYPKPFHQAETPAETRQ